jgi:hypothetical protein
MRRIAMFVLAGCVAATTVLAEGEAAEAPKPAAEKAVSLVAVGAVDDALVMRVTEFVRANLDVPVRLLSAQEATAESLDGEAQAAAKAMGPDDVCLIALVAPKTASDAHGVMLADQRVAVINVTALKPAGDDAETYGRRVEKEVMQGLGMLLAMPRCPNPQCAMSPYGSTEELDAKGRNFCPPCLDVFAKCAGEKGLVIKPKAAIPVH